MTGNWRTILSFYKGVSRFTYVMHRLRRPRPRSRLAKSLRAGCRVRGSDQGVIFTQTQLKGAYLIDLERMEDERGYFARSWCQREFLAHGLEAKVVQCNLSFNKKKGTLRGMHFQLPPYAEAKLVRCVRGGIYDVIIDVRPDSSTFLQWLGVELTADNGRILYVPKGFAHGFQTLNNDVELFYQMSEFYTPAYARGVRWDDPLFHITWPPASRTLSARDQEYEDAKPVFFEPLRGL